MRFAIAGVGGAAMRAHIPAIRQISGAELVAVADPDTTTEQRLAHAGISAAAFPTTEEMLSAVNCDVLVVGTEPTLHAELALLGLRHGVHVVCEKPLTLTRADLLNIAAACSERPKLAVVSVHQYRYSPTWKTIRLYVRAATVTRRRYRLTIEVDRQSVDQLAASQWRAELPRSGGMLADHAVHFLALVWDAHNRLEIREAARVYESTGECSTVGFTAGPGSGTIRVRNGTSQRSTRIQLRVGGCECSWQDNQYGLSAGGRGLRRSHVEALSDRDHVDALYQPLYRDLVARLEDREWRSMRTRETLEVGEALITTLEYLTPAAT